MYVLYLSEHAHMVKRNQKLLFNSVEAARKFMNEKLNTQTTKKYIETLRTTKKLELEKYNQREPLLFRYYGMVDAPLDTVEQITGDAHKLGRYEYRIGNTESAFRTIPSLKFTLEPKEA